MFTEGSKTEVSYVQHWARTLRDRVVVTISQAHGVPTTLVGLAVEEKTETERRARRGHGEQFDAVWCVFDVDEHPNVVPATVKANQHGIGVAVSNPCIELWFLLHWRDQTAHIHRHAAQDAAVAYLGVGKAVTARAFTELEQRHAAATARAKELAERHELDGSPAHANPSSTVWQFVEDLKRPQDPGAQP